MVLVLYQAHSFTLRFAVEVYYNLMKVGIFGSGFGLYGYLPSIIKLGWTPLVLQKSYNAMILRPELNRFADSVLIFNEVSEMI